MPVATIAIFGPTGVGKTDVAVALAELLRSRGEDPLAISADALQVYEGFPVLTGWPTSEQRARLEHRMLGIVPPTRTFSVGEFMPRAHAEIDAALAAGRRPIVVGGTGLYLRAALTDLDLAPPPRPGVRERLEAELERRGAAAMYAELARRAPDAAARIEASDRSRVVRALELLEHEGGGGEGRAVEAAGSSVGGSAGASPLPADDGAEASLEGDGERSELWSAATRHPTFLAGLVMDRHRLYERIDARVDAMVAAGAAEEVRRAEGVGASRTARKALGYEDLLAGDVESMKRRTRNYAKRQLTWMRKLRGVEVIDLTGRAAADVAHKILEHANRVGAQPRDTQPSRRRTRP